MTDTGNATSRTDAELLRDAQRDPEAFGLLYDRHASAIYRSARRAGLAEADALDLVSEVFARAWISRKRFRDPGGGSTRPWLFGIARNVAAAHRRSGRIDAGARKRLRMSLPEEPDATDRVAERLDASARVPELERALGSLPLGQREAVRLRVVHGLGYPDIAQQLRCSEAAARKRVSLGLRSLRMTMEATS
jgi:RNA polymerase sigma-70 factor, ECF subfamily